MKLGNYRTKKDNLVNCLTGRSNVLHPAVLHFQTFLDDIVGITQMQALERAVRFQVELSQTCWLEYASTKKFSAKSCSIFLTALSDYTEQGHFILRICSGCPCLGVLVERLLIENSKLMPWQCLRFEISDRGSKDFAQRFLEKAIAPLVARYLDWERSL
jgi:hypothetical protein